jgi:hypothetical protein
MSITIGGAERTAKCSCGHKTLSRFELGMFCYRGPGSYHALQHCGTCGYLRIAHETDRYTPACRKFVPAGPMEFDTYYCGHHEEGL